MKRTRKVAGWSAMACAAVAALAFAMPGTPAQAQPGSRSAPRSAYPTFSGRLISVAAVSGRDVWAVGLHPDSSLIVHWNGTTWSQSLAGLGLYAGVAASSARDVWAVGGTSWFSPTQTLAQHWDGKRWARVPTPNPAGGGQFNAVAATSARNAWAVGWDGPGPGDIAPSIPLIEHWDGTRWRIQRYQVPAQGGQFLAVTATSPANAWAVGWTGPIGRERTLIEHWDGRHWTRVPSPNLPGSTSSYVHGVTAISGRDAWAVGGGVIGGSLKTIAMHWDGRRWYLTSTPGFPNGTLQTVAASGSSDIWAVGQTDNGAPPYRTIIAHWT